MTITGLVRKPGSYPWRAGITLRDLRRAEVASLPWENCQRLLRDLGFAAHVEIGTA